jgi:hypothetical protein
MRRTTALLAIAPLFLWGCGGDDDDGGGETQSELADMLVADAVGTDEQCLRDKTAELSDDDAQFLIDNFESTDTSGFSADVQEWIDGLIDCIDPALLDSEG